MSEFESFFRRSFDFLEFSRLEMVHNGQVTFFSSHLNRAISKIGIFGQKYLQTYADILFYNFSSLVRPEVPP